MRGKLTGAGTWPTASTRWWRLTRKKPGLKYGLGVHDIRATTATNALEHEAHIAKVQTWLGHSNISATKI